MKVFKDTKWKHDIISSWLGRKEHIVIGGKLRQGLSPNNIWCSKRVKVSSRCVAPQLIFRCNAPNEIGKLPGYKYLAATRLWLSFYVTSYYLQVPKLG
jgi:hypothetical protein